MYVYELKIDGMRCPMCEEHVNDAMRKAFGDDIKVKSNHRKGTCTFRSDKVLPSEEAAKPLSDQGYRLLSFTMHEEEEKEKKRFFLFGRKKKD